MRCSTVVVFFSINIFTDSGISETLHCAEMMPIKQRSQVKKNAIKLTIKLKTSPARLAQLLQPSLAYCFSMQPMTAHRPVRRHWLQTKTKC